MSAPASRYDVNPIYRFFEWYILEVMGKLPRDRADSIQSLDLQKIFKATANDWRHVVREVLALSETIDVAILDLWIRNREHYDNNDEGYRAYAQDFTDNYMKEGSKIDVWSSSDALQVAKDRIQAFRKEQLGP